MKNLSENTDEELINSLRAGHIPAQDYLIDKYKKHVIIKARAYFIVGADKEDVIQEGMIGLFKAIRDYDTEKGVSFRAFAQICIDRQMISAIRAANRRKHMPLNTSVSLNTPLSDYIIQHRSDPEELFIGNENMKNMEEFITKSLSPMENHVLMLYLDGKTYAQIAVIINKDEKAIDNALQRVRRKICIMK